MIRDLSDEMFWAYLAGFFDGEGCIVNSGSRESAALRIAQGGDEGRELLGAIADVLKNRFNLSGKFSIYKTASTGERKTRGKTLVYRRKDMFILAIATRTSALFVLNKILPFLNIKKTKAQDAIRFCKLFPKHLSHLSRKPKYFCNHGHPWVPKNLVIRIRQDGSTYNVCKTCRRS